MWRWAGIKIEACGEGSEVEVIAYGYRISYAMERRRRREEEI